MPHPDPSSAGRTARYEAQFLHGALKNYLQFPDGEPTTNIVEMALEGLRPKLRTALQKAIAESQSVTTVAHKVARNGAAVTVRIVAEPIPSPRGQEGLLLVSFTDQEMESQPAEPARPQAPARERSEQEEALRQLEDELQATRSDLQLTIEELETSNEELKASNEEVMSMNEELQSTNEELETSREELQSLNEELTTVNRQLEEKVGELESTNNDLVNLLSSTNIATLFLGHDLKIRRFTPSCTEFLSLIDTDIGRPISDLALRVADPNLKADADRVIDKLAPVEAEVNNDRGLWFLRRILPYRTPENRIEGVVVTYTDITALKLAAQTLESRDRQQAAVVALGRAALEESDVQALFDRAATAAAEQLNCEFSEILAVLPGRGTLLQRAGSGWKSGSTGRVSPATGIGSLAGYALQTAGPVIIEDLARERRFNLSALNREHGVVSGAGVLIGPEDKRWGALCVLSARKRQFSVDDVNFLQAVANVLSGAIARARAEDVVRLAGARLTAIVDNADDAIISVDQTQKITMFNHGAENIFGYTAQEAMGQPLGLLMPVRLKQAHEKHVRGFGETGVVARRMGERGEIFGRRKDGTEFPAEASISKVKTPDGMLFTAILRDITERKHAEAVLCASCGGSMTLRLGTSRSGAVYRYYSCSSFLKMGRTARRGRSMRMDRLDVLVTQHMADRLLEPGRLTTLLSSLAGRRKEKAAAVDRRLAALAHEAEEADERLRRIYKLVEDGRDEVDDILRARIADLRQARATAQAALERARSAMPTVADVSPIVVERFTRTMREKLTTGKVPFRKAYLDSIVDRVEVDDGEVRIVGRKDVLEQAVLASRQDQAGVHSFVPRWWARQGSNL